MFLRARTISCATSDVAGAARTLRVARSRSTATRSAVRARYCFCRHAEEQYTASDRAEKPLPQTAHAAAAISVTLQLLKGWHNARGQQKVHVGPGPGPLFSAEQEDWLAARRSAWPGIGFSRVRNWSRGRQLLRPASGLRIEDQRDVTAPAVAGGIHRRQLWGMAMIRGRSSATMSALMRPAR
jgi:hypothetical protein